MTASFMCYLPSLAGTGITYRTHEPGGPDFSQRSRTLFDRSVLDDPVAEHEPLERVELGHATEKLGRHVEVEINPQAPVRGLSSQRLGDPRVKDSPGFSPDAAHVVVGLGQFDK